MRTLRNTLLASGMSGIWLLGISTAVHAVEPVRLTANSVARPATAAEAKRVLTSRDAFVKNLSPFDRAARLKTDKPVTEQQLLDAIADQIRPLAADEWLAIAKAFEWNAEQLKRYDVPLPPEVLLIKVTGNICAGAAYTRGHAIVLPQSRFAGDQTALRRLIAHELFHIISRHDAELRKKLYAIVGFTLIDEPKLPEWLSVRKLTNPDAPNLDCYTTLKIAERDVPVVTLLYSEEVDYDPKRGGSFFKYMNFVLMEIRQVEGTWEAVTNDAARPKFYWPRDVPDYFNKIGRNTGYIIHPEEVLADNFTFLLSGEKGLPDQRIVDAMSKVLVKEQQHPLAPK